QVQRAASRSTLYSMPHPRCEGTSQRLPLRVIFDFSAISRPFFSLRLMLLRLLFLCRLRMSILPKVYIPVKGKDYLTVYYFRYIRGLWQRKRLRSINTLASGAVTNGYRVTQRTSRVSVRSVRVLIGTSRAKTIKGELSRRSLRLTRNHLPFV